eukprot:CAMPEP_0118928082 /NCGR_PEP_ID=MMETSP1169-20130426/5420_1 /TAXON_ID=36882 /ORGANISM="Pyramimonas obovata, Strain CCMP722" /LENGTH=87 /DNA_ID=CAMNT_0006869983 /DNA_START=10 /DNA_END=273 /DNA_ORIENTATION=-
MVHSWSHWLGLDVFITPLAKSVDQLTTQHQPKIPPDVTLHNCVLHLSPTGRPRWGVRLLRREAAAPEPCAEVSGPCAWVSRSCTGEL